MILVIGATGTIGRGVFEQLVDRGVAARGFVRDTDKALQVLGSRAEVVHGDLSEPETIEAALSSVEKVFLVSPHGPGQEEREGNAVEAAVRAGTVEHIVKVSGGDYLGPDSDVEPGFPHWNTERKIAESGIPYTFLRPNFFMQNTLRLVAPRVASGGAFMLPLGDARISMADTRDIAAVGVAALTGKGHEGKKHVLTGPEALSFYEVAGILSELLGREVTYEAIPLESFVAASRERGLPGWMIHHYEELLGKVFAAGKAAYVTDAVAEVTGREPVSFERFAREHLEAFGGAP